MHIFEHFLSGRYWEFQSSGTGTRNPQNNHVKSLLLPQVITASDVGLCAAFYML